MREAIREFLTENGAGGDVTTLGDDDSLLDAGVIDSLAMVDLISHLERQFDVVIDEDDMTPENFDSVSAIVRYVGSLVQG